MFIADSFNTKPGDNDYKYWLDLNNDNAINIEDIMIIAKHFGRTIGSYTDYIINKRIWLLMTSP
jgi:hypothetical protein